MAKNQPLFDYDQPGLELPGEESELERRAHHLPRKPGLLEAALTMLLADKQLRNQ
jgi:hypothetical protein